MIQAPPRVRTVVSASQEWLDQDVDKTQVASNVIEYHSGSIERFVQTERQQYALGGLEQRRTQATLPGLQIDYTRNTGQEEIIFTVSPESAPQEAISPNYSTDINLDGYIAFVKRGGYIGTNQGVKYEFFLNDRSLGTVHTTSGDREVVLLTFGKDAMKCHSLSDPFNPHIGFDMLKPIVPPRGAVDAYTNPDGFLIDKHKDIPGYFAYDWWNPANYAHNYLKDFHLVYPPEDPTVNPPLILEVDFLKNTGVILKKGANTFRVDLVPGPAAGFPFQADYDIIAEFYDRRTLRSVSTSWHDSHALPDIIVNDKPLFWDVKYVVNNYQEASVAHFTLGFDLSMTSKEAEIAMQQITQIVDEINNAADGDAALIRLTPDFPASFPPWKMGTFPVTKAFTSTYFAPKNFGDAVVPPTNPADVLAANISWAVAWAVIRGLSLGFKVGTNGMRDQVIFALEQIPGGVGDLSAVYDSSVVQTEIKAIAATSTAAYGDTITGNFSQVTGPFVYPPPIITDTSHGKFVQILVDDIGGV